MANRSNTTKSNTRKKSTASKSTGTRKRTGTGSRSKSSYSARRKSEPLDDSLKQEIMLIVIVAVCILVFLCNFSKSADENLMGEFGRVVKSVMFGIFGFVSYVLPIAAVIFTLFRIFNKDNPIVTRKLIASAVLALMVMTICDMATGLVGSEDALSITDIYKRCSTEFKGGGVIGGSIAYIAHKFLGNAGTWLLIIVLTLICIIAITGRSILSGLKEQGQLMYDESKDEREARREEKEERRRERLNDAEERSREKQKARREQAQERARRREEESQRREDGAVLGGKYDDPVKGVTEDTTLKREDKETEIPVKNTNDRHLISVTDEADYRRKLSESVVAHVSSVSEGSDATREITADYGDSTDTYIPEEDTYTGRSDRMTEYVTDETGYTTDESLSGYDSFSSETDSDDLTSAEEVKRDRRDAETTYQAPVRMNGITIGADPAAYGDGGQKPDASYTTEYGNTMGRTGNTKRVAASKLSDRENQAAASAAASSVPGKVSSRNSYKFPPVTLLSEGRKTEGLSGEKELRETSAKLQETLKTFGVNVKITEISRGPAVTRYEMQPELGVKVSKIVSLQDDIKLSLAAVDIRIEAPIPGKSAIGIEVPNKVTEAVAFRDLIESREFKGSSAALPFAVGKDIAGSIIVHDIAKMPHVLIAGATGSGKSVCINTIIMSILYKCHPDDVRLLMVDPKVVELSVYNKIPHLISDVVTDPKQASTALKWAVVEMDRRYALFAEAKVRDLKGYNECMSERSQKLPHILIIVDELADLMMVASGEVEESICRLAQKARACGIHLVLATQRPSVDVITGLIKANMPSRIAFAVSSGTDSRTILDMNGAEKLLGKGDMLFYPQGLPKPARIQGAFIPDSDVNKVVDFLRGQNYVPGTQTDVKENLNNAQQGGTFADAGESASGNDSDYDELFAKAGRFIIDKEKASIGALQRLLKIGFNRAARIMDQLAEAGVVGEEQGTKPREILMDADQFEQLLIDLGIN